jgi:hypothetical protein
MTDSNTGRVPDQEAAQLAQDLSRLRAGDMTEREFRKAWQRSGSALLDAIWGSLEHYLADGDIRAKDGAYREMQDRELTKLIRLLRDGSSAKALRSITFLGSSGP